MDKEINESNSGSYCDQWGSKLKYNKLALGGDTKFQMLYVDMEIFGARFSDKMIEGGVRPPS